jgi:hypothetical protein
LYFTDAASVRGKFISVNSAVILFSLFFAAFMALSGCKCAGLNHQNKKTGE